MTRENPFWTVSVHFSDVILLGFNPKIVKPNTIFKKYFKPPIRKSYRIRWSGKKEACNIFNE